MGANTVLVVLASLATFAAIFPVTRYVMEWPTRPRLPDSTVDTPRFAGEPVLDESWWQHRLLRRMPDGTEVALGAGKAPDDRSQEDGTVIVESSMAKLSRGTASNQGNQSNDKDPADDRERNHLSPAEWAKVVRQRSTEHACVFESILSAPTPRLCTMPDLAFVC